MKLKYGDFITLKPNSEVVLTIDNKTSPPKKYLNDGGLWAVDEVAGNFVNINRVLTPYPGAYCSWVNKKHILRVIKR